VTSQPAHRMHSYHVHYIFRLSFRFDFLKQFICVCIIYAELHFNISKEIWQTNWFPNCNAWRILNTAFHSPGKYSPELCGRALSGLQWSTANVSRSNSAGDRVSLEHWSQVRKRRREFRWAPPIPFKCQQYDKKVFPPRTTNFSLLRVLIIIICSWENKKIYEG